MISRLVLFAISAFALVSCGDSERGAANHLLAQASGPIIGTEAAEFQRLIDSGAPLAVVRFLDQGMAASLLKAGERAGVVRWRSSDNVQIYTRSGMIIGTRGLGSDLMTADTSEVAAALFGGRSGQVVRVHRVLDGQDNLKIQSYVCDIVPFGPETIRTGETRTTATMRVDEDCHGPNDDFTNHYWLTGGRILQSDQQISAAIGSIQILFLP